TQYDPRKRYIESIEGNIVFTSSTGLPLVRYNIQDIGGTISDLPDLITNESGFKQTISKYGIDIEKLAKPFVYVHGRSDFAVSLYAVLIYPENIKKALLREEVTHQVSSRFVMDIKHKRNLDQYFEILVELRKGVRPDRQIAKQVQQAVVETL